MGKIANVEFGSDDSEILVFSNFGSKVTVWSLWTAKSVEIKDPKFSRKGYGRSATGRNGVFAILTRPGAQDTVSLHVPGTYGLIKSFAPQTVDAQGLQWSPDGRWLAIWDAASSGYKVLIYTADGNLFRTYQGDCFDDELKGLGVKALEWSPNGDFLIVAGFQKTLTLLGTRTVSSPSSQLCRCQTADQTSFRPPCIYHIPTPSSLPVPRFGKNISLQGSGLTVASYNRSPHRLRPFRSTTRHPKLESLFWASAPTAHISPRKRTACPLQYSYGISQTSNAALYSSSTPS